MTSRRLALLGALVLLGFGLRDLIDWIFIPAIASGNWLIAIAFGATLLAALALIVWILGSGE